jgi:hypothetical protein
MPDTAAGGKLLVVMSLLMVFSFDRDPLAQKAGGWHNMHAVQKMFYSID